MNQIILNSTVLMNFQRPKMLKYGFVRIASQLSILKKKQWANTTVFKIHLKRLETNNRVALLFYRSLY